MKRIFLVAGEISGDTHGAALMRALADHEIEFSGLGGPQMSKKSAKIEDWLEKAAVLGLWEVLKHYFWFRRKMDETLHRIAEIKPDAVILIDYPGFNLRVAKRIREIGFPCKLIYYISPQVWAWKKGRIKTMAELLDLMICIFPFEKELYEESGLPTEYSGHPIVDSLAEKRDKEIERDPNRVALLPGSREREVETLFPPMVAAAVKLREKRPELHFAASAVSERLALRLRAIANEGRLHPNRLDIGIANPHEIMQEAGVGVVASGTATLEAAWFGLPYCLVYKVAFPTYVIGKMLVKVRHLGIVNVIAGREVVRELLQGKASGPRIAAELERLLSDPIVRSDLQRELAETVAKLGKGGAHKNAASAVLKAIGIEPAAKP